MIYLIDDNQSNQRQKKYNITYIEDGTFSGHLTSIRKIEKSDNLDDISHLRFLENADCILLHKTTEDFENNNGFLKGSTSNVIKIIEEVSKEGEKIPLVLFSNSDSGDIPIYNYEENPNFISSIKKDFFYERLVDFVEHYRDSGTVELRILAHGKNFEIAEIRELVSKILNHISYKSAEDLITLSNIYPILDSFKLFISKAYSNIDSNDIINEIEDSEIKIQEIRDKLKKAINSFEKYGKNIHNW